eukprot:TRINITY_DN18724_c0_g2_i3.p1 TRINITY_DN18724_c0_g2~~TRINITY_DN18724_c0_g2_i3.p1  ORF type:complete len:696 (+),score=159.42 TRINITY_DN18724_c0_g2_i3:33-2120(+)
MASLRWMAMWVMLVHDAVSGMRYAVPYVQSGNELTNTLHDMGLRGEGEVVGVLDTGLDNFHCAFDDAAHEQLPNNIPIEGHRKIVYLGNPWGYTHHNDTRLNSHGTSMAGAAVGHCQAPGHVTTPNPASFRVPPLATSHYSNGVAPAAKLALWSLSRTYNGSLEIPHNLMKPLETLYEQGARVFVMAFCGGGPRTSNSLDTFALKYPDAVLVGAAGNNGLKKCEFFPEGGRCGENNICQPHTSRNTLTAGGIEPLQAARKALGYPSLQLELTCKGVMRKIFAYRGQFSPYPVKAIYDTPIVAHSGGAYGCGRAANLTQVNAVFVAARGECFFSVKAANAKQAKMLLVVNNKPFVDGPMEVEDTDTEEYLPSFMISAEDGKDIEGCRVTGPFETPFQYPKWSSENVLSVSGRGSFASERVKPDVVAPADMVLLPRANTTHGLIPHTGSSVATALIGGAAALLREAILKGAKARYGLGEPVPASPSSALIRGLLVHTAVKLTGGINYDGTKRWEVFKRKAAPDPFQGHGRVELQGVFEQNVVLLEGSAKAEDTRVCFRAADAEGEVVLTVSWTEKGREHPLQVAVHTPSDVIKSDASLPNLKKWTFPAEKGFWAVHVSFPQAQQEFSLILTYPRTATLYNDTLGCTAMVSTKPRAPKVTYTVPKHRATGYYFSAMNLCLILVALWKIKRHRVHDKKN